jgi:predicted transcriptional regulator of viral defense system
MTEISLVRAQAGVHFCGGIDTVRKEREEGSSESMTDIMRRLSRQSVENPKFHKNYGHPSSGR